MRHRLFAVITVVLGLTLFSPRGAQAVDYLRDIKPLLAEKCYACHGALAQESSLRLETLELMSRGGDSGAVIVPGDSEASLLIERIAAEGFDRMPPPEEGSAMTAEQITLLRKWIDEGAKAPAEPIPPSPNQHWAFQPIERPPIPRLGDSQHPIDALLQAKREPLGIQTQPPAEHSLQLRRLYLDLIGLPPTIQQLQDPRPWNEIVDELLTSPQHGERWARHWMDIWRYCDWYGLGQQLRYSQKHLWRWRDWIVDSLNEDKGYDRMILEMIAGDELEPMNPEVVVATGYLARNYYLFNRTTWLDNTIEHTSKAFIGLTMNCAKCHDHKYDPLSQQDYYRMRAIFEPHQVRLDPVPGVNDFERDGLPRVFDDHVDAKTFLHRRGDPKNPDTENPIQPGVPQILSRFAQTVEPIELPPEAYAPGIREHVRDDRLRQLDAEVTKAEHSLTEARKRHEEQQKQLESEELASGTSSPSPDPFVLEEDFDTLDSDTWRVIGSGWQHRDGSVHQTVPSREPAMLRLNQSIPRDFELVCDYTTTGGSTYKSVTFRFDQTEDLQHANFVYTSAHAPGPKVQAAYTRNGNSTYPNEARRARKIEIGRPCQLRFAVRDTLVNVWVDGEFQFAYRFPSRRDGFISLSGFDATVAFDSIEIRSLDPDLKLQPADGPATTAPSGEVPSGEVAVALAKANLKLANARRVSFAATWKADRARFVDQPDEESMATLSREASRRQLEVQIAEAEVALIEKSDDQKSVHAAKQRLASAAARMEKLATEPADYQPIRGSRKALESPAHKEPDYPAHYSPKSTGRRLALARWIASNENPLTARVAVNHVWLRHFGTPLVESVFDFGLRSKRPVQSDVLDFLAYEFMASGWSLRHLHRLIVTSDAYRLSSSTQDVDAATLQQDPSNQFYWRMNARRMESQVVRDSLLHLANRLDTTVGGPSIDPTAGSLRRSLYFKHSRDQQDKFLEMFDDADELQCYRRSESIVPQQALALSNSKVAIEMSSHIAARFAPSDPSDDRDAFIQHVFLALLGRSATEAELSECQVFFETFSKLGHGSDRTRPSESRMRERFVHAILNHNDFVTIR